MLQTIDGWNGRGDVFGWGFSVAPRWAMQAHQPASQAAEQETGLAAGAAESSVERQLEGQEVDEVRRRYEQQLDQLEQASRQELEQGRQKYRKLQERLHELMCADRLKTALAERGVHRVSQASQLLAGRLRVEVSDLDELELQVLGSDGQCVHQPGQGSKALGSMVDTWLRENPHFLPPSGDFGSGEFAGMPSQQGASIEQLDLNPRQKAEFVARYGPAALVRLSQTRNRNNR